MDYQMMEEIGTGAFGRAIKAKRRADQEHVVVKELIGRRMTQKEISEVKSVLDSKKDFLSNQFCTRLLQSFDRFLFLIQAKNEVKVLAHLNHPNIVRYFDFYSDSGKMHIVMEFCEVVTFCSFYLISVPLDCIGGRFKLVLEIKEWISTGRE